MQPGVLFEGSGAELAEQIEKLKDGPRIKVIEVSEPYYRTRLPKDVVWEDGIPIVPRRGNNEPVTMEQIKEWLEDD